MASTYEALLIAQISVMGLGIVATPVATASNGTATSGTVETLDAVLGVYQANLVAGRRYEVRMNGLICSTSTAGDEYAVRIRNSNSASTPTAASALVAENTWHAQQATTPGREATPLAGTFLASTSGVCTFGFFAVRLSGTGVFTPFAPGGDGGILARELFVADLGVF